MEHNVDGSIKRIEHALARLDEAFTTIEDKLKGETERHREALARSEAVCTALRMERAESERRGATVNCELQSKLAEAEAELVLLRKQVKSMVDNASLATDSDALDAVKEARREDLSQITQLLAELKPLIEGSTNENT